MGEIDSAIKNGDLEKMKELHKFFDKMPLFDYIDLIELAIIHGQLKFVKYLHQNIPYINANFDRLLICATKYDNLEIFKYIYRNCYISPSHYDFLIGKLADDSNVPMFKSLCTYLIKNNKITIINYSQYCNRKIAENLTALKYMKKQGFDLIREQFRNSNILMGNFNVLKFSRKYNLIETWNRSHWIWISHVLKPRNLKFCKRKGIINHKRFQNFIK